MLPGSALAVDFLGVGEGLRLGERDGLGEGDGLGDGLGDGSRVASSLTAGASFHCAFTELAACAVAQPVIVPARVRMATASAIVLFTRAVYAGFPAMRGSPRPAANGAGRPEPANPLPGRPVR